MLCPKNEKCVFFKKYENTKNIQCKGFIRIYCRGGRHNDCEVRSYLKKNGEWPEPDYMPNGYIAE